MILKDLPQLAQEIYLEVQLWEAGLEVSYLSPQRDAGRLRLLPRVALL